ncbi:phenylalanine--tRNA ligase beta subunit-related protein [Ensifer adhaerens]|uniref:B3/B4 domain-containing protein n=1 Tax=Ensifer adhaerens TaxID=106592 RepID=UPI0023A9CC46|nr:phenylalanine--tRNA ligase beta subunit-related protein [Ensifer adhaerens]WDZ76895.1 phenylalanine--tRNA ligase beta subunit-related protein [Ensifer adhaerens]
MHFQHANDIWRDFPELSAGALFIDGVRGDVSLGDHVRQFQTIAGDRLDAGSESDLPEIQAWRRAFAKMGMKPTQYRSASEALLRRFRKEGNLPAIHPLIDLCNAASLAFAIPIAVFDLSRVSGFLHVRRALGSETYLTFAGETENPEFGEVIFADADGRAHARRWTNRQSGHSAIRPQTTHALIVAEALHETAVEDIERLMTVLHEATTAAWGVRPSMAMLDRSSPRFDFST